MKGFDLLGGAPWRPLARFGFTHPFFNLNYETIIHTWIILGIIFFLLIITNFLLKKGTGTVYFLATEFVSYFDNLCKVTLGSFSFGHLSFITTLFTFIFSCSLFAVIHGIEEPTKDINTTVALGITAFLYIQFYAIKENGLLAYFKGFLRPFFVMLPLNIIGKIATVVSLSFRLFGNIFGGWVIANIYYNAIGGSIIGESIGLLFGVNLIITLFGLFEGFLQAFVFSMLTITYLSIALEGEGH